jgi:uncharacterized membrane protein HdeD (DUF308 family)
MSTTDMIPIAEEVREKRGWFIALGIFLIVVGAAAILSPYLATFSLKLFIGWFLVISGLVQIVHAFSTKNWSGFFWELIVGIMEAVAGAFLLLFPVSGIIALTVYLAIVLVVGGMTRAYSAFKVRPEAGWIWILVNGIASIMLGALLWAKLPSAGFWAIGLLFGVNIAMTGWSLIMIALGATRVSSEKIKA